MITASLVKELRDKTSAGMMDCKKALVETKGDLDAAVKWLREKGISKAAKKADRTAKQGIVFAQLDEGGQSGTLIEVNCETDFVAKTDDFKGLCRDLCLQIAAANPTVVSRDEVSAELLEKEKEIAEAQAAGKPPPAVQKIVEGKLAKYYSTVCLLDQPFVKNPDQTISEYLTSMIHRLGENMNVNRFTRYQIGE